MKKLLVLTILCFSTLSWAQNEKYIKTMEQNVTKLDTASTAVAYNMLANNFERIAKAEKNEWLPYYYAAYCYVVGGFMARDMSKADAVADKAEALINKADTLKTHNSEIMCVMSMINGARIMVDPQTRGMKYGMLSSQQLSMAKTYNPDNPRPYLLESQSKLYTPEQWGGGKAAARMALDEGRKRLASFKPESSIAPHWGEKLAEMIEAQMK
ncbi:MAG TPA: hypothetical protein VK590_16495 [Saprospiraceae bacterium]|nr:hypothetical protein [Saprospiraceae bacterium]